MTSLDPPSATHSRRIRALFDAACDLPRSDWMARLQSLSATDAEQEEVLALLERDLKRTPQGSRTPDPLQMPVAGVLARMAAQDIEPGDRLGPWRVGEKLGEGGMGQVFRATREDGQFTQTAALKILTGLPTGEALERLHRERQILASLSHPNIARLIDGGTTPRGRPYLVMDLVEGEDIEMYCKHKRPDLATRVALLRQICLAVAYAHQRLTLHCDLKPSNIMVDKAGRPILLDFGIAQLTTATDATGAPGAQATPVAFTPRFSSPEQQEGKPLTTAADVYSLGRLLGDLTFKLGAPLQQAELTAIVDCATAKDPQQRYLGPEALADDLQRFLDRMPLAAMPRSTSYIAQKFLQRRWGAVGAVTAFVLVAAILAMSALAQRDRALLAEAQARAELDKTRAAEGAARRERDRAQASETRAIAGEREAAHASELAESERDRARRAGTLAQSEARRAMSAEATALREAKQSAAVRDFLIALFTDMDHAAHGARQLSAYDLLEQGRQRADQELAAQPELHAAILMILARVYERTGDLRQAKNLFQATVDVERKIGTRPLIEADALMHLALVQANDRAHAAAEAPARASLALRLKHAGENELPTAESHSTLALTLSGLQKHTEAREHMSKALAIRERVLGPMDREVAFALHNLGQIQAQAGEYDAGIASYRRSIAIKRAVLDPKHASIANSIEGLGQTLRRAGRLAEAEPHLLEAYKLQREINGPASGRFASAADSLANLLHDMGRVQEARGYYKEAVSALEKTQENAVSVRAALYLNNLASAQEDLCKYEDAERHYRRSIEIRRKHMQRDDPAVLRTESNLGRSLVRAGKYAEAQAVLAPVVQLRARALPADHGDLIDTRLAILESEVRLEQRDRAMATWMALAPMETKLTGARKLNFLRAAAAYRTSIGDTVGAQGLLKLRWDAQATLSGAMHNGTLLAQLDYAETLARTAPADAARIAATLRETLAKSSPQACGIPARIDRLTAPSK